MTCLRQKPRLLVLVLMSLLSLQTHASDRLEEAVKNLSKGSKSPYSGVLIPKDVYYEYESCLAEKQACIDKIDSVPQPINLSYVKESTYFKTFLGASTFVVCLLFAMPNNEQHALGVVSGCGVSIGVMTLAYVFN